MWLGWRAIVTPPAHDAARAVDGTRFGPLYASAVGLTFTNPMTIMAFGGGLRECGARRAARRGTGGRRHDGSPAGLSLVDAF